MADYTKITDYAAKDALTTGDPAKLVKGTEIGAEFDAIATAIATKYDDSSLGTNVGAFLSTPSSANLRAALTDETGTGAAVFATSPTLVTPALGTPASGVLTNCTGTAAGLTAGTASAVAVGGITGLGTGAATFLATPSSANLRAALTDETGTGVAVFSTSPTLVTPDIGAATATSVNSTKVSGSNFSVQLRPDSDTLNGSFGAQSVAIGWLSNGSGTGSANVTVGTLSGGGLTTGGSNTLVGYQAGFAIQNGANNTCIGNASASSSASVSNEITLGNSSIATLRCQVTSITSLSDARDKTDVVPLPSGIDTIMALNPVRFTWNMRDGGKVGIKDAGFIAQELQAVDDEYLRLVYSENPEKLEASYGRLIPVLVKAIQDLQQQINELKVGK